MQRVNGPGLQIGLPRCLGQRVIKHGHTLHPALRPFGQQGQRRQIGRIAGARLKHHEIHG